MVGENRCWRELSRSSRRIIREAERKWDKRNAVFSNKRAERMAKYISTLACIDADRQLYRWAVG